MNTTGQPQRFQVNRQATYYAFPFFSSNDLGWVGFFSDLIQEWHNAEKDGRMVFLDEFASRFQMRFDYPIGNHYVESTPKTVKSFIAKHHIVLEVENSIIRCVYILMPGDKNVISIIALPS